MDPLQITFDDEDDDELELERDASQVTFQIELLTRNGSMTPAQRKVALGLARRAARDLRTKIILTMSELATVRLKKSTSVRGERFLDIYEEEEGGG